MKSKQFKTNILCGSCVEKVMSVLMKPLEEITEKWILEIQKILTVSGGRRNEIERNQSGRKSWPIKPRN
jgi:hypothetical protein